MYSKKVKMSMPKEPLISVLIPVYNTEKFLTRCLDSIVNQTYKNIEIIIINDGSPDNSESIIQSYEKLDKRIFYYKKQNGGLSSARNEALKHANGEYILNVDSDDWLELNCLENCVDVINTRSPDIIVFDIFKNYVNKQHEIKEPYSYESDFNTFLLDFTVRNGLNSIWNKLIKKNLYTANNIKVYEDISLGEDSSTLLRLILHANSIIHINKPLYHYNLCSNGMSQVIKKNIYEYVVGFSRIQDYYSANAIPNELLIILKFKLCYLPLHFLSLKKAREINYLDYIKVAKLFKLDIQNIKKSKFFKMLNVKYKLFFYVYSQKIKYCTL